MKAEVEIKNMKVCPECGITEVEMEFEPIYECNNCGEKFTKSNSADDGHQCPQYNRFAAELSDYGCPECNEEVREQDVYIFEDEIYIDKDTLISDIQGMEMEVPKNIE